MHCFDLSGASEADEVTVASFNPMLEFMTSHQQSSTSSNGTNIGGNKSLVGNYTSKSQLSLSAVSYV